MNHYNKKLKKRVGNMYKVKYSDEDLSLIFQDPLIFSLFNIYHKFWAYYISA